jgi:hypothetical protein
LHSCGEVPVLGQEAVTGVDGIRADLAGGADRLGRVEVASDRNPLISLPRVEGAVVVGRVDGDRPDAEPAACGEDADGDLAAVRYEELADSHRVRRLSLVPCPNGT